ncbi:hypothetical protein EVAR_41859_1 [Eumeta japonica]|uniref:Uncharacterized protein n=1 Tax=Eumeta variegata TaxID=151549 RepID=A0A4C1XCS3_EUMVA|nr:hypothetical protein EVAR_41859_1 [Eumeta japonica]
MTLTPRTRFLCCVPPERAATTLGYGQATLAVAGILCVFREILMYFYLFIRYDSDSIYQNYHIRHVKDLSWVLLVLGLCLTFAVFLLVGTEKRRPGYVLTYLIFGVLGTLALAVYWLVLLSGNNRHFIYDGGVDIFLIIIVYSQCLRTVYFVYRNIKLERNGNNMIYNVLLESNYNVKDIKEKNVI